LAITGMVHFNVNCSDYDRSRAFYAVLGFREVWRVPERNTPEVAAAVGMPPYLVKGGLLALEGVTPPVEPASMPQSSGSRARFVCFRDPDGTVLELVENG
jgi:catechol 2,3-dioxygenase-like lactoylglutathione lyase family enzyme